jgi:hypothetical protein
LLHDLLIKGMTVRESARVWGRLAPLAGNDEQMNDGRRQDDGHGATVLGQVFLATDQGSAHERFN